jgi:alpha-L-rhamnosidase
MWRHTKMKKFPAVMLFGIMVICTEFMLIPSCLAKQADEGGITVEELQCEYAKNPLGIDTLQPRFSWILESNRRGQMQSAYHILVASNAEQLERGIGDKWDSGKVASEKSVNVPYQGKSLASEEECYWKVRVWDKDGKASAWSEPAAFEMGLLKESDWQGQWIGMSEADSALNYIPGRFGQALNLNGKSETVKIEHYPELKLVKEITISAWIKPNDDFSDRWQEIYRKEDANARCLFAFGKTGEKTGLWFGLGIDGAYTEHCGPLAVELVKDGKWHLVAAIYDGSAKRFYFDGREIARESVSGSIDTKGSSPAYIGSSGGNYEFFSGGIDDIRIYSRALSADEIKGLADGNIVESALVGYWKLDGDLKNGVRGQDGEAVNGSSSVAVSPLLRREFEVSKKVRRARVYISGLGWYELYINGKKVGDHVLDPATTDYDKRIYYVTHDVTDMLKRGTNTVGVMLGNGWFRPAYCASTRLLFQLHIGFADGTGLIVKSDESWKASEGPIAENSIISGEVYDARKERSGWTATGFDDSQWHSAAIERNPGGVMVSQLLPPIKVNEDLAATSFSQPGPEIYIYDFGKLFAGWAKFQFNGKAGTQITIKYAPLLRPDGFLKEIPNGRSRDVYIMKGSPEGEVYEPRFTFHPVRYVQIEGYPGKLTKPNVTGRMAYNAVDMSGGFECSNDLLNQIHANVRQTIKNELYGIQMDCINTEHWGWLEPGSTPGTLYPRIYMPLFWKKYLDDARFAQHSDGVIPEVIPNYPPKNRHTGDPAWAGNYPIAVWYVYQYFCDERILEEHYPSMKKWLESLMAKAEGSILRYGYYGDHMLPGPAPGQEEWMSTETPMVLIKTAFFYNNAHIISKTAKILGYTDEATEYYNLAEGIKRAFNNTWFNADTNQYATGSQTSNLLPLVFGIVPPTKEANVTKNIVDNIVNKHNGHHHTGNVGTSALMQALTKRGYGDVMYNLINRVDYPGWGYMVDKGATTIWESWGAKSTDDDRLSMAMFTTVDHFFYNDLAGIKGPEYFSTEAIEPGFKEIVIKPFVPKGLYYVKASHKTVRGRVSCEWRKGIDWFTLEVRIPVNASAKIGIPKLGSENVTVTESSETVWENGKFIKGVSGIIAGSETDDYVTFDIGSGSYTFRLWG